MATDNILYVSSASIAVGTITDASGVGLVPSASHALVADDINGSVSLADTASYVAGANVDGAVASSTSSSYALVAGTLVGRPVRGGTLNYNVFEGSPLTYTVTLDPPFPDNDFGVSVIGGNNRGWTVESVTNSSFIISSNSAQALDENVYWVAVAGIGP
jgi:hypothetical protein